MRHFLTLAFALAVATPAMADEVQDVFGSVSPEVRTRLQLLEAQKGQPIQAVQLSDEYKKNEFSADKLYKNQYVLVYGTLTNLTKDRNSQQPVVHLNGLRIEMYVPEEIVGVMFDSQIAHGPNDKPFLESAIDTAAKMTKGQTVLMSCRVLGKLRRDVQVDQCLVLATK